MLTRMEKEIYLMINTSFDAKDIFCMDKEELDWWVTSTRYLLETPAVSVSKRRRQRLDRIRACAGA